MNKIFGVLAIFWLSAGALEEWDHIEELGNRVFVSTLIIASIIWLGRTVFKAD